MALIQITEAWLYYGIFSLCIIANLWLVIELLTIKNRSIIKNLILWIACSNLCSSLISSGSGIIQLTVSLCSIYLPLTQAFQYSALYASATLPLLSYYSLQPETKISPEKFLNKALIFVLILSVTFPLLTLIPSFGITYSLTEVGTCQYSIMTNQEALALLLIVFLPYAIGFFMTFIYYGKLLSYLRQNFSLEIRKKLNIHTTRLVWYPIFQLLDFLSPTIPGLFTAIVYFCFLKGNGKDSNSDLLPSSDNSRDGSGQNQISSFSSDKSLERALHTESLA